MFVIREGLYAHPVIYAHPVQSSVSDDGRKHHQKHVELTRNNKLTHIVASRWLYS
jgi:hypothetical protein